MHASPEARPISIIITTVAAQAYQGETDIGSALDGILTRITINNSKPRVPNPVNPVEDFADKWGTPEGAGLQLEKNFFVWLEKVKADLRKITQQRDKGL